MEVKWKCECVCICVPVLMGAQKDTMRSVHEQTVQMPSLVHGDLIKSDDCWRVQWQMKFLTSPHICCAPVSLHHSALPGTIMISPEVRWHQVCGIYAFVHTEETAWIHLFTSLTHAMDTPNNPMSLKIIQQNSKASLAAFCSCGYEILVRSGGAVCWNVGVLVFRNGVCEIVTKEMM